jgi:hypothetical protein
VIRQTAWALPILLLVIAAVCFAYLVPTEEEFEYIHEPCDQCGTDVYLSDATWCELCGTFVQLSTAAEVFAHLRSHAPDTAEVVEP